MAEEYSLNVRRESINLVEESEKANTTIVHGDFCPKNILIYNSRVGLIDFEESTRGDPAYDLGYYIAHFILRGLAYESLYSEAKQAIKSLTRRYFESLSIAKKDRIERRAIKFIATTMLYRIKYFTMPEYLKKAKCKKKIEDYALNYLTTDYKKINNLL